MSAKNSSGSRKTHTELQIDQQKGLIKGTVKDHAGEPLIGANVINSRTKTGISTNLNGEFQLECQLGDELRISYVGYNSLTVKIQTSTIYL